MIRSKDDHYCLEGQLSRRRAPNLYRRAPYIFGCQDVHSSDEDREGPGARLFPHRFQPCLHSSSAASRGRGCRRHHPTRPAPLRARHGRRLADRRPLSVLAAQADQEPTELEDDVAKALFELQEQVSAGLVRSSGALEFVPWWLWWRR
jgi:hypothetical protein